MHALGTEISLYAGRDPTRSSSRFHQGCCSEVQALAGPPTPMQMVSLCQSDHCTSSTALRNVREFAALLAARLKTTLLCWTAWTIFRRHVQSKRLLAVDVLACLRGRDASDGMPVIRSGDDDSVTSLLSGAAEIAMNLQPL